MNEFIIDLAERISTIEKEEIPTDPTMQKIGNARHYIKKKLFLSVEDHAFSNSFRKVLHSEGGHAFTSNKYYFRLTRNIGIEIALLLISKFEDKYRQFE